MVNSTSRLTRGSSPGGVGRMGSSPATRQGVDLPKCQWYPYVTHQQVDRPAASRQNPNATPWHKGANDAMNPTITTETASYMEAGGPNHHHRLMTQPIWEREAQQPSGCNEHRWRKTTSQVNDLCGTNEDGSDEVTRESPKANPELKVKPKN